MAAHPDAPQDHRPQDQQQQHTAHQAQLLAAGGKNKVGVPGGQSVGVAGLGVVSVEIALAEELAGADGQNGPGLLKAVALGVQAVVHHHAKAHDPVVVPKGGLRQDKEP